MAKESPSSALQGYYNRKKALAHYGTKGMKWGVRHDPGHEGERAKTKQIAKLDKQYDKFVSSPAGHIKIHNAIAGRINPRLDAMNRKPEYQIDMTKNPGVHKKYLNEYKSELEKACNEAMKDLGSNASGTQRVHLTVQGEGLNVSWAAYVEQIQHADTVQPGFGLIPTFDSRGKITGQKVVPIEDVVSNSELKHWGVKGMKWGVRKERVPEPATISKAVPGRRIKADGGKNLPASEDAINAVKAHRVARKSTTDALSNKELQALVNRMQLEQQYNQLNAQGPRASAGRKFLNDYLQNGGKDQTMSNITEGTNNIAKRVALLLPGSRAAQVGVEVGSTIARAYVNKISGGKKK